MGLKATFTVVTSLLDLESDGQGTEALRLLKEIRSNDL